MLYGCAAKAPKSTHKRLPPQGREPGEVMRPTQLAPPSEVSTPARKASMRLVEMGKGHLDTDNFEFAMTTFRDAINVDTTNGIAYYYLALTYNYLDQPDLSSGLLDKAEQLIGEDEEWKAKVLELRTTLGESTPETYKQPAEAGDNGF